MNIEHRTTPIEHWIVDGKAYRLATEADVGKEVYFDDHGIGVALSDPHFKTLTKITKSGKELRFYSSIGWKYAYIQDDSLLTPQRTPVPALGDGWFLLRDDEVIEKGDMVTSGGDYGYVDANTSIGKLRAHCQCIVRAARYFGPAKEPEPAAEAQPQPAKPIDWTKPVRTKDGRAVRVLCTDGPGEYPVVGFVDGEVDADQWTIEGKYFNDDIDQRDLENAPQRIQREYWVNVYPSTLSPHHSTKQNADNDRCDDCIACVKITIDCEEGEGL